MSKFKQLQEALEKKGYSSESAGAITAAHGRKVYGNKIMEEAAKKGVSAESIKRRLQKKAMEK